jgi:hypothetical protein
MHRDFKDLAWLPRVVIPKAVERRSVLAGLVTTVFPTALALPGVVWPDAGARPCALADPLPSFVASLSWPAALTGEH